MSEERGRELARFEADPHDQRVLALVRGISGAVALLGSLAMLLGRLPVPLFLVALLGLVMSLVWLRQARRLWRSKADPALLVVHAAGFVLGDTFFPFGQVTGFAVDEERLDVVVTMASGELLRIEPQYSGVDIHSLVVTLQDALGASRGVT